MGEPLKSRGTCAAPGPIPPRSGTRQASEVDRRRPEATEGDRRRPEAKPEGKTRLFNSRRKINSAKRLRPTAATTGRRRRSQRRLHAPTATPPPLPQTTATRDRAEENTSAEAEASGGGQRRTRGEYNTQQNQRQKQRQQRERREDRKRQTAQSRAGDLRSQRGVQRRAHSGLSEVRFQILPQIRTRRFFFHSPRYGRSRRRKQK